MMNKAIHNTLSSRGNEGSQQTVKTKKMMNKTIHTTQVPQGKTPLSFGEGLGVRLLLLTTFFCSLFSIPGYAQTSSVAHLPVFSGEISGPQNVCLHVPTTYTLNENDPDFIYVWKAEGGKVIGNNTGQQATVVFTSPNGKISVVKQLFVEGDFLRSEPKTLHVQQMDLRPKIINSSNAEVFYTSSIYTFSLDLGGVVPDHIQWHIVGNGAYKNFGNIINGIYDTDVTVSFNEVFRSFNGAVVAEVTKCGVTAVAAFGIKLQGKPLPNIKHKKCEYENAPDPRFYLDQMVYNYDEPVTLTIPNYNPDYLYRWSFLGTHYFADGSETKVQFSEEGNYNILLTIITPDGCTFSTHPKDQAIVTVLKPVFDSGNILPMKNIFCEKNPETLSYMAAPFLGAKDIIWMRDNVEVNRNRTYTPTESGAYWPILVDENGGKSYAMVQLPKIYILQQPPYAGINGSETITYNQELTLYGITTDETVEHRWSGVSLPAGYDQWSSEKAHTLLKIKDLDPGTYDFTFHTRFTNDNQCVNSHTITIEVTK